MSNATLGRLFTLPATLLLIGVIAVPTLSTIRLSLTPTRGDCCVIDQYSRVLTDPAVHRALSNTLFVSGVSVAFFLVLGLSVALFLNRPGRVFMVLRVITILPWTVPDVAVGLTWRWIYHPTYGALNDLISRAGIGPRHIEWLSSPDLAIYSIIAANVWRGYPFVMLILLAGLQSIPRELYESASLDGANLFNRFRFVTIPGLRQPLIVCLALSTVWEVRRFALVSIMTGGGPGRSTEVMSTFIYKQYFQFFRFEYASAVAIILTVILLLVSIPYIRGMLRTA